MVVHRLKEAEIRINEKKCQFMKKEVEYLGYLINKEGLKPIPRKMEAIIEAQTPQNTTQLRSYLGMLNYYSKFLKNISNACLVKEESTLVVDERVPEVF